MAKPVKPTAGEKALINRRLKKMYPQMYDNNGNLKEKYTGRKFSSNERLLRKAGIGSDAMPTDMQRKR